jgi:pyruvate dehydrogenase E2 component (dihydrolipoamide acetyltransferase)
MAWQFILPDIGEGVVDAEVQKWFVKPGDKVVEDQPLVEVMTDKATVTIPSPKRGTVLKLHWKEGEIAKVHQPLVDLDLEGGATAASAPAPAHKPASPSGHLPAPAPAPAPATRATGAKAIAAPAVRAMARELGMDINVVPGSGPGGRVTKDDLKKGGNGSAAVAQSTFQEPVPLPSARPVSTPAGQIEVIPFRGLRKKIAEKMAQSVHTAAHFTFVEQVDVTELKRVKGNVAAAAEEQGVKVTYLPFIVKAVVAALKKHPTLNATLDEAKGEIQVKRWYNIGIASATEAGLVVPVVKNADKLSLLGVASEINRISADTKAGKGKPDDMSGSTFTITSLGAQGGLFATPVINFPEVAILGIHKIQPTPVVRDGQIVARDIMYVSLSFDHRVIDGHVGAAFTYTLIRYLEDPNLLFMEMV